MGKFYAAAAPGASGLGPDLGRKPLEPVSARGFAPQRWCDERVTYFGYQRAGFGIR